MTAGPEASTNHPASDPSPASEPRREAPWYRWLGWSTGLVAFVVGCTGLSAPLRWGFWLCGIGLILFWVIERFEAGRPHKLMRPRMAALPLLLVGQLLMLVGAVCWLYQLLTSG